MCDRGQFNGCNCQFSGCNREIVQLSAGAAACGDWTLPGQLQGACSLWFW
jgi:hypothetical protein